MIKYRLSPQDFLWAQAIFHCNIPPLVTIHIQYSTLRVPDKVQYSTSRIPATVKCLTPRVPATIQYTIHSPLNVDSSAL